MKKKSVLAVIAAAIITGGLALAPAAISAGEKYAERGRGFHGQGICRPFGHLDRLQYRLGLTDEQVEKIFRIDQEYREKYFKNRKSFEAVENLRLEREKAVEDVLTDKQKERYREFRDFRKDRSRGHHRFDRYGCQRGW